STAFFSSRRRPMRGKPRLHTVVMYVHSSVRGRPLGRFGAVRTHAKARLRSKGATFPRLPRAPGRRRSLSGRGRSSGSWTQDGSRPPYCSPLPGQCPVLHGEGRFHIPLRGSAGFDPWVLPASLKRIALSRYSDTYLGGLDLTPACEAGQAAATQAPGIPPMSSP